MKLKRCDFILIIFHCVFYSDLNLGIVDVNTEVCGFCNVLAHTASANTLCVVHPAVNISKLAT